MTRTSRTRVMSFLLILITIFTMLPAVNVSAATTYDGGWAVARTNLAIFNKSTGGTKIGTIYANEGFTVLSKSGNTYYVNYSTPNGAKQGYFTFHNVYTAHLPDSCVGIVKSNATTYYGPNTTKYDNAGSVYKGEIVAVLEKYQDWAYIEYNVPSGRRQAYVKTSRQDIAKDLKIGENMAYTIFKREDFPSVNIGRCWKIALISYLLWKTQKRT